MNTPKTDTRHTPTPWLVCGTDIETNKIGICQAGITNTAKHLEIAEVLPQPNYDDRQDANAAYIVRACNSHDALVAALEAFVKAADAMRESPSDKTEFEFGCAHEDARVALAQAKGQPQLS